MTRHPGLRALTPLALAAALLLAAGCTPRPRTFHASRMGTEVSVTIHDAEFLLGGGRAEAAADSAFAEMARIEYLAYRGTLAKVNRQAGIEPVDAGGELIGLIREAYRIEEATGGAFTPNLGPLVNLWGIGTDTPRLPDSSQVDSVMRIVRRTAFTVTNQNEAWLKPRRAALELGAIAKGYAVDRAVAVLREQGVTAGMVWAGGDLRVFGSKPEGGPWRIAVRHPRGGDFLAVVEIDSGSVATSGDYERYFERGGVRYHHIFDPATGYPSRESVSATAVAPTCLEADAWATALFVMGPVQGPALAAARSVPALVAARQDSAELQLQVNDAFRAMMDDEGR